MDLWLIQFPNRNRYSLTVVHEELRENSTIEEQTMARSHQRWTKAALALAIFGGTALVWGDEPTTQQMMQQIQQLQAKVDRLEANQAAKPASSESTTAAVPATAATESTTAQAVENNADQHKLFDLGSNFTGGWVDPKGFVIRSDDGNFVFHPGLTVDFRFMGSYRENIPPKGGGETGATGNDFQSGFDVTRLRLIFDGSLYRNISYFVQLQADEGAPLSLLDAYGAYRFDNSPFSIKAGQFKDPVWHERNLSETNLLAVDRSLVESLLGGGQTARVQGVGLVYDKNRLRAQAVYHDGFNSTNTKFFEGGGIGAGIGGGAGITPTDWGTSGRAEYMLIGHRTNDFNPYTQYDQFTSLNAKQTILVTGIGADFSQAGSNDVLFHTVDLQLNSPSGFSAYGAYLGSYRDIHANQGVKAPGTYNDQGFLVQAAWVFNQRIEPFVRYDYTHLDGSSVTGLATNDVQEFTVGGNYYFYGQRAKFTLDGTWLPNGSPADFDALGILKDSGNNEFVFRAQFQLVI
jgi:hypothetical protein